MINLRLFLLALGQGFYLKSPALKDPAPKISAGFGRRSRDRRSTKGNPLVVPTVLASIFVGSISIFGLVHLRSSRLLAGPSKFTDEAGPYPTIVPFKETRGECERSGRQWKRNQCVDAIHDSTF
ncbi:hypothetical protein [cf. Phormidesmis sp. LEGE 11477]|uniref:hypothetical protein n=1 Tax=cf. Phormidesmis sp. LEGE 11477 TaxID=1828680 RepID=UPI00187EDCDB|nr:hypothetical protein [cf. Phormidesmis sp. LEGE 11477]MBE9061410.1 hypothetical protein [cf. Phormidesmis sp. LEGE 11477]